MCLFVMMRVTFTTSSSETRRPIPKLTLLVCKNGITTTYTPIATISEEIRAALYDHPGEPIKPTLFSSAQMEILQLMQGDCFPRWAQQRSPDIPSNSSPVLLSFNLTTDQFSVSTKASRIKTLVCT